MKKRILTFTCSLLCSTFLGAQNLHSLGVGITASNINDLAVYKNQLYAGGFLTNSSGQGTEHIRRFVNGQWVSPQGGVDGFGVFSFVSDMAVIDDQLHVVGGFDIAGGLGVKDYAIWDSLQWSGNGMDHPSGRAVFEYRDTIYCSKSVLTSSGGIHPALSKWDGTAWKNVGSFEFRAAQFAVQGIDDAIIYQNNLVIAGEFQKTNGINTNNIAQYDGNTWSSMGNGLPGKVRALEIWNNELYAAGYFYSSSYQYLAKWDGSAWQSVNNSLDGPVETLYAYEGRLFIGGAFTFPNASLAIYDGNTFQAPFKFNGAINAFVEYEDSLVIAGNFDTINGKFYDHIVAFTNVNTTSISENKPMNAFAYPNPVKNNLYLNLPAESYLISVYTIDGRKIYSQKMISNGIGEITLSLQHIPAGVYNITCVNGKNEILIKERMLVQKQ